MKNTKETTKIYGPRLTLSRDLLARQNIELEIEDNGDVNLTFGDTEPMPVELWDTLKGMGLSGADTEEVAELVVSLQMWRRIRNAAQ